MADEAGTALEMATDEAVAACDGDARAAVSALLVLLGATETEIEALKAQVARIEVDVSSGYIRKNLPRPS